MPDDSFNAAITWLDEPLRLREDGPLAGRTLLVKDLFDTAGIRTTYGSRIYADHVPERTAPTVTRLLEAGATLVGKANLHEFAWGTTSQNPWYGTVRNPAHPGRTTGGSSGGNAAALSAGLCDLGLGTDTGCSVRLPSACCETIGLKTSWGLLSTEGVFPLCPTLDTVGPMARTVADAALMWSVLSGRRVPVPRLDGLTVGLLRQAPAVDARERPPVVDTAEAHTARLQELGARVVEADVPDPDGDTWAVFFHEAARSHAGTYPARAEDYGENVRRKLELAQDFLEPARAADAYGAVERWRRYEPEVDLYAAPVLAGPLPAENCDELAERLTLSAFSRPFNLLGWAALAIGDMQLVAPRDEVVLAAGLAWERG